MAIASFRRPSFRCLATCGAYSFDWLRACVKVKMRSMATPNDHIDMKNNTKATPFATYPICAHICIKSTVHPPRIAVGPADAGPHHVGLQADAGRYCNVKLTVTVMMTGTG